MKVQLRSIAGGCLYLSAPTWDAGVRFLIGCKRIDAFLVARSVATGDRLAERFAPLADWSLNAHNYAAPSAIADFSR